MTIQEAFIGGMRLVRESGFEIRPTEPAALVAFGQFEKAANGKDSDPRFATEGPKFAKRLILECLYVKAKQDVARAGK